jgi:hypothetical protein
MSNTAKPETITVQLDNIPNAVKGEARFVGWKWTFNPNKGGHHQGWDKPPLNPRTGQLASSTNSETWSTYQEAVAFMKREALDGLGLNLLEYPSIVVHDLDNCRHPETGEISPQAMNIVRLVGGYWEVTPSGTGIRGICRGRKTGPRVEASKDGPIDGAQYDGSRGRYVTLTGQTLPESTPDITNAYPGGIEAAYALMFPAPVSKPGSAPAPIHMDFDDAELLARARRAANGDKFNRLWSGDTAGYQSESEADEALCCLLAYWTGGDAARMDRLFRQSGLYRDKWDRADYRIRTIQNALELVTEFYHPGLSSLNSHQYHSLNGNGKEWPEPGPLPQAPRVPNLPADFIPAPLRAWLVDLSERACIPLEFLACPALVGISAIVGRSVGIHPGRFDDWLVVPNLWGAIVGRPGVMKSYAVSEALKPLARLAAEARDRYQAQEALDGARRDRIEAEITAIKGDMVKAAKAKDDTAKIELERDLAGEKAELLQAQPPERRHMTQDATVEKLGELLRDNPRGLLLFRDELSGWLRTLDKAGREGDREFFLESWNGTGGYTFDRVSRGTIHIPAVTVALVGGIQPGKLQAYIDEATANGGGADGLLQRIQLAVWPDGVGEWRQADRWPDKAARDLAYGIFKALDRLKPPEGEDIPALRFAPDAQDLFDAWRHELESRLRSEELSTTPTFESHVAKFRSLMPSLALLFHLINVAETFAPFATSVDGHSGEIVVEQIPPVSLKAAQRAAAWVDFLECHARKVYASELTPGVEAARALSAKIKAGEVQDGATVRSIYDRHWSGLSTNKQVVAALDVLCSAGWVQIDRVETGGRPSDVVRIHPSFKGQPEDTGE